MNTTTEETLSTADLVKVPNRDHPEPVPANGRYNGEEKSAPLFAADEGQRFRTQWSEIQTAFVDEPRSAVERADHLVAEAIQRLATVFADERANLERGWSAGDDKVSTEDLRIALRRYRSFFDRLLSV